MYNVMHLQYQFHKGPYFRTQDTVLTLNARIE